MLSRQLDSHSPTYLSGDCGVIGHWGVPLEQLSLLDPQELLRRDQIVDHLALGEALGGALAEADAGGFERTVVELDDEMAARRLLRLARRALVGIVCLGFFELHF